MATTPMMQQYEDAKRACGNALLLFRMGDFYELFHEDAKAAARTLGLTLTSRDKGDNPIPMAGFPHHQLDSYLSKLIAAGYRAAVCEQMEDPRKATGLVKREITRLVTPGTLTDDALLDPRESNYLAAIAVPSGKSEEAASCVGLAWAELSTGRFQAGVFPLSQLGDQLARLDPSEILVREDADALPEHLRRSWMITPRPAWAFSQDTAVSSLSRHFQTATLDGFGFDGRDGLAVRAAGAVLDYLQETQKCSLGHIDRLLPYRRGQLMEIDEATWRSLELTRTIREGRRNGSLLSVLDRTMTAMGSRLLCDWLANPLMDRSAIEARHDAVAELMNNTSLRREIREYLRGIYDLERLLARVTTGRATPRDLSFICRTLRTLPELKTKLQSCASNLLQRLEAKLDLCPDLCERLENALVDDCPLTTREGGIIRSGYHTHLDELRELATGGKKWIAEYQAQEIKETGITNLKVGFNKVFGYYIELTNTHREKAPAHYVRKQTLKNAERFITPKLKEYEEQVLTADEKAKDLEYELFMQLRDAVQAALRQLQAAAAVLARIDVLAGLADLARDRAYCRPQLVDEPILRIRDGRHPVLDVL